MDKNLSAGDTIALVANSDPLLLSEKTLVSELVKLLENWKLKVKLSPILYSSGLDLAPVKARIMNQAFADQNVKVIFDLSGGNMANTILPFLNFTALHKTPKLFCGYSDLTSVLNALYAQVQVPACLFQIKTLVQDNSGKQARLFYDTFFKKSTELYHFDYSFIRGNNAAGKIIGGNIRCFLKLAGTKFFPDLSGKILFLESYSGQLPLLFSQFSQLTQLPHFSKLAAIMLGTFTKYEQSKPSFPPAELLAASLPASCHFPIIQTDKIGHSKTSRALLLGKRYSF
ncbi:S66 peptidase family protein [Liquorilactobacillus oeni]|uniref:Ld-carboxypeptidase n=1 Tax=Liquorilactobacillus oeni DSM 19972 TaxID=1423777 RepID=A0A0R1MKQ0_9LACO|nr:LD-carboxypeptidase [Liquorilactobacillus oeni]KRL05802.1 ld-carboxypeptidase [Liquorilactobacillus oeni DSM 19972]